MAKRIWKYSVEEIVSAPFTMPRGAKFLAYDVQGGQRQCWFLIPDVQAEHEPRLFGIYGTGSDITEPLGAHLATWLEGSYVWHLFELVAPSGGEREQ